MPEVSQRFIDLLNVPLEVLREIAEEKQVIGYTTMTTWALAEALDSIPRAELEQLTRGFLYAGRTSVTFFRLTEPPPKADKKKPADGEEDADEAAAAPAEEPEEPVLEGVPLDEAAFEAALGKMSAAGDPFNDASRPKEVTRAPQLVFARKRDVGSVLMTFVTEGTVANVIHNFRVLPVVGDEFFSAVVYPAQGLVEVRTNQQNAARFGRSWLSEFAKELGLVGVPVTITPGDFNALAEELDAGTTRWRGKNTGGGAVDTIEVGMAVGHATLTGDKTFEDKTAGTEQQLGDLLFTHDEKPYRIRVSRTRGSIYFVTAAPEAVIDYVREALRRVKVRHIDNR